MNRISLKLLSVLAIILFIAVIPIAVLAATNENVSIISTINDESKQEYIIYIKETLEQKFKFAFTTNENPGEMDLIYINSISDLVKNQVAFLDAETYEKISQENKPIFMWAKDENENLILKGIQIDLTKSISNENIDNVETLTKRIEVEIADSEEDTTTIRNENIEGVDEIANVGHVKIIEKEKGLTYYYEMTKLPGEEKYNQLMALVEKIREEYDEMDMYEKIQIGEQFNKLYSEVTSEAKWQKVENMTIKQPEESVAGDKYIVLLKKVDKKGTTTMDIQFLTAFDSYKPNIIKEEIIVQETTKLPITYDSIALFVVLGIIVALAIVVFIRIKKLSNQNEGK